MFTVEKMEYYLSLNFHCFHSDPNPNFKDPVGGHLAESILRLPHLCAADIIKIIINIMMIVAFIGT